MCFKFGDDRLRGLASAEGQFLPFPIDFDARPYNTLTLPCERMYIWERRQSHTHVWAFFARLFSALWRYILSPGTIVLKWSKDPEYNKEMDAYDLKEKWYWHSTNILMHCSRLSYIIILMKTCTKIVSCTNALFALLLVKIIRYRFLLIYTVKTISKVDFGALYFLSTQLLR